jgi:hypothetical protein
MPVCSSQGYQAQGMSAQPSELWVGYGVHYGHGLCLNCGLHCGWVKPYTCHGLFIAVYLFVQPNYTCTGDTRRRECKLNPVGSWFDMCIGTARNT